MAHTKGQWWRLLTSGFLHPEALFALSHMVLLNLLGPVIELGRPWALMVVYMLSIVASNITALQGFGADGPFATARSIGECQFTALKDVTRNKAFCGTFLRSSMIAELNLKALARTAIGEIQDLLQQCTDICTHR